LSVLPTFNQANRTSFKKNARSVIFEGRNYKLQPTTMPCEPEASKMKGHVVQLVEPGLVLDLVRLRLAL
jgi:hypothetical protein